MYNLGEVDVPLTPNNLSKSGQRVNLEEEKLM